MPTIGDLTALAELTGGTGTVSMSEATEGDEISGAVCIGGEAIIICAGWGLLRLMRTDSSPSLISISATSDSCIKSISFLILRMSISNLKF